MDFGSFYTSSTHQCAKARQSFFLRFSRHVSEMSGKIVFLKRENENKSSATST